MVKCRICGENLKFVQWTHLRKHGLTPEEYKEKYPNSQLQDKDIRKTFKKRKVAIKNSPFKKGHRPWNKDRTKETDERIERYAEKIKGLRNAIKGRNNPAKREDVRRKISESLSKKITLKCHFCGRKYKVKPSLEKRSKYCSRKCKDADLDYKGETNPNWKGGLQKLTCEICGREYYVKKYRSSSSRFCSQECYHKALKKETILRKKYFVGKGEENPMWKGGYEPYYGPNWPEQKRKARKKDNYACQICKKPEDGKKHDVHHVVPFRNFDNYREANELPNLTTLCHSCHSRIEKWVVVSSSRS